MCNFDCFSGRKRSPKKTNAQRGPPRIPCANLWALGKRRVHRKGRWMDLRGEGSRVFSIVRKILVPFLRFVTHGKPAIPIHNYEWNYSLHILRNVPCAIRPSLRCSKRHEPQRSMCPCENPSIAGFLRTRRNLRDRPGKGLRKLLSNRRIFVDS